MRIDLVYTMPMKMSHETCPICTVISEKGLEHINFLEVNAHIPQCYLPLNGWEGKDLSSGYQKFVVQCPECQTKYLVEIDVEPFVWDFDVTRLTGKAENYTGYYS